MSRRPWFPWFESDYLSKTLHLTEVQDVIYRRLLGQYWIHGALPSEPAQIANLARISTRKWNANAQVLLDFFELRNGRLYNRKMEAIIQKAKESQELAAEKGRKGGLARAKAQVEPGLKPTPKPGPKPRASDPDPHKEPTVREGSVVGGSSPAGAREGPAKGAPRRPATSGGTRTDKSNGPRPQPHISSESPEEAKRRLKETMAEYGFNPDGTKVAEPPTDPPADMDEIPF